MHPCVQAKKRESEKEKEREKQSSEEERMNGWKQPLRERRDEDDWMNEKEMGKVNQ